VRRSSESHRPKHRVRSGIERKRFSKYKAPREGQVAGRVVEDDASTQSSAAAEDIDVEGRPSIVESARTTGKRPKDKRESAIDILYENQRGGIFCGFRLFSGRALGFLDPAPWTNIAQKASATDIKNAQCPDPSWEWAWADWSVNHQDDVDDEGWEYSFMFSKRFSWHGPSWYNSCVRRRAWIRMRYKVDKGLHVNEAHNLTPDYFTINAESERSRNSSQVRGIGSKKSFTEDMETYDPSNIRDIGRLMRELKLSRIDREKMEAIENFVEDGGEDLVYLKDRMHDIMASFIFQASRKTLLAHLSTALDEAIATAESQPRSKIQASGSQLSPSFKPGDYKSSKTDIETRIKNLEAAVAAADSEVKTLEYWSDIKDIAEKGQSKGAVDVKQGWNKDWIGLDFSGPRDVITEREVLQSNVSGHDDEDDENTSPIDTRELKREENEKDNKENKENSESKDENDTKTIDTQAQKVTQKQVENQDENEA
jgi:hypothetical protein